MTTRTCPLDHPGRPAPALPPGRSVCWTCTDAVRALLADAPATVAALDARVRATTSGTRGASTTGTGTAGTTPAGAEAAEASWVVRDTVVSWLGWITETRDDPVPGSWPEITAYLGTTLAWTATRPEGAACVDELTAALRHARRVLGPARPRPARRPRNPHHRPPTSATAA
jgi:hypothetical protein